MQESQEQVNQPVSNPVNQLEPVIQKQKSSYVVVLLSSLLLISCILAGFFAYQTRKLVIEVTGYREQLTQTPMSTTNNLQPTTDPTANWKTYSGDIFSFSYPNDWDYYQPKTEGNMFSLYVAPKDTIKNITEMFSRGGGFGGGKFLTLSISEVNEIPTYESDEYQKFTSSPYKLDNINTTRYFADALQDMPGLSVGDKTETIVFKINGKNYLISLIDYQYKAIFDQILSTFKFTN